MFGGFHTLAAIRANNTEASEREFFDAVEEPTREGVPLDLWRALPDSPDSLVWVDRYVGPGQPTERVQMRLADYQALPQ